jgi:hypothetical protein
VCFGQTLTAPKNPSLLVPSWSPSRPSTARSEAWSPQPTTHLEPPMKLSWRPRATHMLSHLLLIRDKKGKRCHRVLSIGRQLPRKLAILGIES